MTIENLLPENQIHCISKAKIPTQQGDFTAHVYISNADHFEHLALVKGNLCEAPHPLVRIHSECLTGDVFGSRRCDCGAQLEIAMEKIAQEGCGVIVYLRGHEGRGIGLGHKLRAYNLQDQGRDTVEANIDLGFPPDLRQYAVGAQILFDLGITSMRLLTNNPAKCACLLGYGLKIEERVSLTPKATFENQHYLRIKKEKLGHLL